MFARSTFARIGKSIRTQNVDEAIEQSGLDWNVVKKELQTIEGNLRLPNFRGVFRHDTGHNLGVVGTGYGVVQNREAAGVLSDVISESSEPVTITHGADIYGGDKIFLACEVGDPIMIGSEYFTRYILCSWAHNGGVALKFSFMLIRNRTNALISVNVPGIQSNIIIRHTKNAKTRLKIAGNILKKAFKYFNEVTEKMNLMSAMVLLDNEFDQILKELFPADPDKKRSVTQAKNRCAEVKQVYNCGVGSNAFKGTRLGGFLAVAEWTDEKRTSVRENKNQYGSEQVKMNGLLFGQRSKEMKKAFVQLLGSV